MIPVEAVIELNVKFVEDWKDVPIGTDVVVTMDDGTQFPTRTRSAPELLGGHSAVIWLENIRGCYHLKRVRKA